MTLRRLFLAPAMLLPAATVLAQSPVLPGPPLAEAARRFPQPVRVAALLDRAVLQPTESQTVLGRVSGIRRQADGTLVAMVQYGGFLGFGRRPIAVPIDAMALLGADMEIMDLTPRQLDALPTFDGAGTTAVPPDSTIAVGLARPSH